MAILGLILGIFSAASIAALAFGPLFGKAPPPKRVRYQIADLFWLAAILVYPLSFVVSIRRASRSSAGDAMMLVAALPLLATTAFVWRMSIVVLQQHRVTGALRRGAVVAVAMPVGVIAVLAFSVSVTVFLVNLMGGQGIPEAAATAGAAACAALACRLVLLWALRPRATDAANESPAGSPFDAEPPNTSDRSD